MQSTFFGDTSPDVPRDVAAIICSFLDVSQRLKHTALLNKQWNNALLHPLVWQSVCVPPSSKAFATLCRLWVRGDCCPEAIPFLDLEWVSAHSLQHLHALPSVHALKLFTMQQGHHDVLFCPLTPSLCFESLQSLELHWCDVLFFDLPPIPNLHSLIVSGSSVQDIKGIHKQKNLTSLRFQILENTTVVGELPHALRTIVLSGVQADCSTLPYLPCLTELDVESRAQLFSSFNGGAGVPAMEAIHIQPESQGDCVDNNQPITPFSCLEVLACVEPLTDADAQLFANVFAASKLRELAFNSSLSDTGIRTLFRTLSSSLVTLHIRAGNGLNDQSMQHLTQLRVLEELRLSNVSRITSKTLTHIASLPRLRKLCMFGCPAVCGFAPLVGAQQLRDFRFFCDGYKSVPDSDAEALSRVRTLHTLHLSATPTESGLAVLSRLSELRVLGFAGGLFDCPYDNLALFKGLEELQLPICASLSVSEAVPFICQLRNLRRLFADSSATAEDKRVLREHLPKLEVLECVGKGLY